MTTSLDLTTATFDPRDEHEWQQFRALAHRMVDDTLSHIAGLRSQPTWRPTPPAVRAALDEPVPYDGVGAEEAYRQFVEHVRPYPNGNIHPRFWGWVMGAGTPLAMMSEMLAAAVNPNMAGLDQAPALVEKRVVAWLAEVLGFPSTASGILSSGGTMANLIGVTVARHAKALEAGVDVNEHGVQAVGRRMVIYGSTQTHNWIRRAAEILGLGSNSIHSIPVDDEYRVDVDALRAAIRDDRAAGHLPFCVVGTAGTVNTGATDDLQSLLAICREEKLWFHVDGAFGALARLSPALASCVQGMEEADSLAVDLHKWGSLPFECACALVRDDALHRDTFAVDRTKANYLAGASRGLMAAGLHFSERGIELTRGFKALKVWMSIKAFGVDAIARSVEQSVAQSRHLRRLVENDGELELMAPAPLNIVCFRWAPSDVPAASLDAINEEIVLRLQESGVAVPSSTRLRGHYAIRVANVNHRTRLEDVELLVEEVKRLGREITRS